MEHPARYGGKRNPGKFDAMLETNSGPIVLEWEIGNISSSHRSLNKMALGITRGEILGGILVVPSRAFAQYQTLSLARRPACVVKGTPSYIVGQAWSLPSYRRVGVPAHARLRGRCSRRATTGSASALSSSGPSMNPACLLRRVHSFKNRIIPRFLPFEPCVSNRLFYAPIYRQGNCESKDPKFAIQHR